MGTGKKFKVFLAAFILTLILPGMVHASASVFATGYADWSLFRQTVPVDYSSLYSIAIAEAERNGFRAPQVRNDLSSWGSVSFLNTLPNTSGYGATTPDLLSVQASAIADGITAYESFGSGFVVRGGYFTVPQTSLLNFSIPYSFYHEFVLGAPTDSINSYAMARIWLAEKIGQGQTTTLGEKRIEFRQSNVTEKWSENGNIMLDSAVSLEPGKDYVFDISIFNSAYAKTTPQSVVPEPATMLLLGTGLMGAIGLRRKKSR